MANIATITNNVISALSGTTSQVLLGNATLTDFKLDSLTDVSVPTPGDGDVLRWNAATSLWEASDAAGITGSGVAGQVAYFTGATTQGGSNNLFWDATNNRLGIGTNAPTTTLDVSGQIRSVVGENITALNLQNAGNTSYYNFIISGTYTRKLFASQSVTGFIYANPQATVQGGFAQPSSVGFGTDAAGINTIIGTSRASAGGGVYYYSSINGANHSHRWYHNQSEQMRLWHTGNLALGNASTDNGLRFQVTGDGYFSGSVGVGVSPSVKLQVNNEIATTYSSANTLAGGVIAYIKNTSTTNSTDATIRLEATGSGDVAAASISAIHAGGGFSSLTFGTRASSSNVTERMRLDYAGNLGLGVVPSAWGVVSPVIEFTAGGFIASQGPNVNTIYMGSNHFYNGTNFIYKQNGFATQYQVGSGLGSHHWYISASGTAGNPITFTQAMTLFATGNLAVGTTTDAGYRLDVNGTMRVSGASTFGGNIKIEGTSTILQLHCTLGTPQNWWVGQDVGGGGDGTFYVYNQTSATFGLRISKTNAATFGSSVTVNGASNFGATLQITGASGTPTSGAGLELAGNTTTSAITSFNRTLGTYLPIVLNTLSYSFLTSGTEKFAIANSGAATFSSSVTATQFTSLGGRGTTFGFRLPDWQIYNTTSGNGFAISNYTTDILTLASTGAATFSSSVTAGGVNVGTNSLGTDRMLQVSGTAFTIGATQYAIVNNPTMGTLTNIYGYYGGINVTSATNAYGIYVATSTGTITNKWGIYQEGILDRNYFNGNVLIGTTSDTSEKLQVNGTMRVSGASTFARITTVTSGVTLDYNSGILYHAGGSGSYYQFISGADYYISNRTATGSLVLRTVDTDRLTIASTGAATFSSSVTANTSINGYQGGVHNLLIDFSASSQVTTLTNTELFFGTNAQRRMTISSGGNVLVGDTNNPGNRIIAYQNTTHSSENSYSIAAANASSTGKKMMLGYDVTLDVGLIAAADTGVSWKNISIPWGNVGIANTNPSYKLDVTGEARVSNAIAIGTTPDVLFPLKVGSLMTVSSTGNVGIGTTTPAHKLDVVGTSRFDGTKRIINSNNLRFTKFSVDSTAFADIWFSSTTDSLQISSVTNSIKIGGGSPAGFTEYIGIASGGAATFSADATINGVRIGKGPNNLAGNIVLGTNALNGVTTGGNNTAIGAYALRGTTTGTYNIAIGPSAGGIGVVENTTGSLNIFIGAECQGESATDSNRTWIGSQTTTSTWLAGNLLLGTKSNSTYRLDVVGTTRLSSTLLVGGVTTLSNLAGTGTRIVVADASGALSTQPTSTYLSSISGEATNSGSVVTLTNSAVIGKVLTGLNVYSASIASTDSILTAFGKIQGQIDGLQGGTIYKGSWNANTNTPTITSSTGTQGNYYVVTTAGTTTIDGVSSWAVGDWIIFNGTVWEKIPNVDAITSVNGQTGVVSLTTTNINEGTNLYYTDTRARAAISLTTSGSSGAATYSSGVLNIPTYTLAGLGGASAATTITINGTAQDLSANRTFNVGTVTSIVAGSYLTGGTITSSGTIAVDATTTNTASKIVARDASGNFSAGTITAALSGNATTATTWQTARTITIGSTGKSVDGSGNVSWSLGEIGAQAALTNPVTGTGASGQVAFWNGTTSQTGTNNLFWDNANSRLGIGTQTPGYRLDINDVSASTGNSFGMRIQAGTNSSDSALNIFSKAGSIYFSVRGDGNIGLGTSLVGATGTSILSLANGTAPSSNMTDTFQMYSADITANNAAPHFRTENGGIIKLYQQTTGVGNSIFSQGGGNSVLDDSTFDGYTLRQIVKALRNSGLLA